MGAYTYGGGVAHYEDRATIPQAESLILAAAGRVVPSSVSWLRSILPSDVTSPIVHDVTAGRKLGSAKVALGTGSTNEAVFFQIEAKNYAPITLPSPGH
jgi:hypothetical protein